MDILFVDKNKMFLLKKMIGHDIRKMYGLVTKPILDNAQLVQKYKFLYNLFQNSHQKDLVFHVKYGQHNF